MSKRIDALKQLKEYVEQGENVRHYYAHKSENETCYCAVGYLGHLYGVSDEQLIDAGMKFIGMTDDTNCILDALSTDFKEKELYHLQCCNDDADEETLLAHIDNLIEKTNKEEF